MSRPRYTLDELLAEAEASGAYPLPAEEREWVDAPAVGREWPACETLEGGVSENGKNRTLSLRRDC